jgi:hypothetical protein
VNDILLSVDSFHVERLPLGWVRMFAEALCENYNGIIINASDYYIPCEVCRAISESLR